MNSVILNISPVGALIGIGLSVVTMLPILWLDVAWDMVDAYRILPDHRQKGFWSTYAWRKIALPYPHAFDKVRNYYDYTYDEYRNYQAGSWLRSDAGRRSYFEWRRTHDQERE